MKVEYEWGNAIIGECDDTAQMVFTKMVLPKRQRNPYVGRRHRGSFH